MLPDKPANDNQTELPPVEESQDDDTLIVAPPGFRERLLAAQKARTSEIRQSVEIPNPLLRKPEENVTPQGNENSSPPDKTNPSQ